MPTYFQNPENALKRANEFCELRKEDEAIECLFEALKSRKCRLTQQTLENIINKFLELCVLNKKSQVIKDGLYNYRYFCQGVNEKSWEDAVRKYIQLAESKVENAKEAYESVILDIDDLDQDLTSTTLLKFVSSEGTQERTEKIILIPWIKFLWECYRNCLDLLRNTQLIKLYHIVVQSAFKFCEIFSRRNEFRKLYNILKVQTKQRQAFFKTDDFEAQLMHLETEFVELESAFNLELWQDAFKTIIDIHSILNNSKKLKHSRIMVYYFNKISCIYWKGEEYLFHAAANLRHFQLIRDQKKNTNLKKLLKLASRTVLSVLGVLPTTFNPSLDLLVETDMTVVDKKNRLLSSLLDLPKYPTRISLIKEVVQVGIIEYLPKEIKSLFIAMELESTGSFLSLSEAIKCTENCADHDVRVYMPLIQKVIVVKLLPILSNMFVNISMSKVLNITGISEMSYLEFILVDVFRRYEIPLRIDHKNMYLHFPSDFNVFQKHVIWDDSSTKDSPLDNPLKCLMHIHSALKGAVLQIDPDFGKNEMKSIAEKNYRRYNREKDFYRKKMLDRKKVIEKQKEFIENERLKKEEEEKKSMAYKLLQYEIAERQRLQRETEERQFQRLQREKEDIKRKLLMQKMENFKKNTLVNEVIESLEDFGDLEFQILLSKQIEQLNKERKELALKLQRQERTLNHFERAKRLEEIPLLQEQYEKVMKNDVEFWKGYQRNKIETAQKERARDLHRKNKFLEMKEELKNFIESVKKRNFELYNEEMLKFMKMLEEEKRIRLQKRAEERKRKRKNEWIKQYKMRKQIDKSVTGQNTNLKINNVKSSCEKQKMIHEVDSRSISPQCTSKNILDDAIFGDTLFSEGKSTKSNTSSERRYDTTKVCEKFHIPRDIYYCQKLFKSHKVETELTEIHKQKSSLYSNVSKESYLKSKQVTFASDYYNNRKTNKCDIEENDKSTLLWRDQPRYSCPITNQGRTNNSEVSQRTITILRRETTTLIAEDGKGKNTPIQTEKKFSRSDNSKNSAFHSCTPWAKLKRQTLDK